MLSSPILSINSLTIYLGNLFEADCNDQINFRTGVIAWSEADQHGDGRRFKEMDGAPATLRLLQRQGNDLIPHSIGDAVPDPGRERGPVLQPLGSMFDEAVIPPVKRGGWDADLGQGSSDGQMRLLHQPDDLKLLRGSVPHS